MSTRLSRTTSALITMALIFVMGVIPVSAEGAWASHSESAIELTQEEQKYIDENPDISIAIDTSWIPYGFTSNDNTCGGVIPNMLGIISDRVGLNVKYVTKPTYMSAINACNSGETTLVSGIADDPKMSEKNDVMITDPYITISYSAITKNRISDLYAQGANYRVAICVGTYAQMAMQERMPNYEFISYPTNKDCMNAVSKGEVEMALVANYSAEYYRNWHEFRDLQSIQINDFSWGLCFGVNKDADPMLIEILNKGIASITENDANQAIYAGATSATSSTSRISDVLFAQPVLFAVLTSVLVLLTAVIIFMRVMHRRKLKELETETKLQADIDSKNQFLNEIPAGLGIAEIRNGKANIVRLNDCFYRLINDSREERNNRTSGDFIKGIDTQDQELVQKAIKELQEGKEQVEFVYRAVRPHDKRTWLRFVGNVVERTKESIVIYFSLTCEDRQMEMQLELQESIDIANAAMSSSKMVVWSWDAVTHRQEVRKGSPYYHGIAPSAENVPESLIADGFIHPDSAETIRKAFNDILTANEPIQNDCLIRSADMSSYRWERMILTPVYENGKVIKAIGASIDISRQKEKENKYFELIDNMATSDDKNLLAKGRYNISRNRLLYYNRHMDCSLKLPENCTYDDALQGMLKTAELAEDKERMYQLLNRQTLLKTYAEGKNEGTIDYKRSYEYGSAFWSSLHYNLYEEPSSRDLIFFVYTYDITEKVRETLMIEKLGSIEYDVLGLIDVKTHLFASKSIKGIRTLAAQNNQYIKGNFEDIIAKQINSTVLQSEREETMLELKFDRILEELEKSDVYYVSFSALRSTGEQRRKQLNFSYLDETRTTVFYYCKDITEIYNRDQNQLERIQNALKEAKAASESKTEFFSRMSHDMRTPMNGILGLAHLSDDETDIAVLKENIAKIESSGDYLLSLINDTLDFQRIESGKLQLDPQIINGRELVTVTTDMLRPSIKNKKINIQIKQKNIELDWYIKADPVRIKQIFINLISNSIKFTPEGGSIYCEYECLKREGMISHDKFVIRDTGVGMSEDFIKNKIFHPFAQEHNAVSGRYAGSGLGLSIVKSLVELMGGSITVESTLGVGTTFTLYIDFERVDKSVAEKSLANIQKRKKLSENGLRGIKILLAEDHPLNAEIAKKLLNKAGCEVTWVKNGQECVDMFNNSKDHLFDVILMDIRMPVLDGIKAAKCIRKLDKAGAKEIPIIAMTANAYDDDKQNCLDAGMNNHIAKPIEPEVMYETICNAVHKNSDYTTIIS